MKPYSLIGIILIVVAVAFFGDQGINYTAREKVIDLGPLQMTAEKTNILPLSAIVGGFALLAVGQQKS